MGLTILSKFPKTRMLGEVMGRVMLNDQITSFCQKASGQDHFRQLVDLGQCIRRSGKYETEWLTGQGQKGKYIHVLDMN